MTDRPLRALRSRRWAARGDTRTDSLTWRTAGESSSSSTEGSGEGSSSRRATDRALRNTSDSVRPSLAARAASAGRRPRRSTVKYSRAVEVMRRTRRRTGDPTECGHRPFLHSSLSDLLFSSCSSFGESSGSTCRRGRTVRPLPGGELSEATTQGRQFLGSDRRSRLRHAAQGSLQGGRRDRRPDRPANWAVAMRPACVARCVATVEALVKRRNCMAGDLAFAGDDGLDLFRLGLLQLGELVERPRRCAASASKSFVELRRQRQKREVMRNGREVDAHAPGDLGVRIRRHRRASA